MLVIYNLDTDTLVAGEGFNAPITELIAKRGDGERLRLILLKEGIRYRASGSAQFRFIVKPAGHYESAALALAQIFVFDTASTSYDAQVNYIVDALDALLNILAEGTEDENADQNSSTAMVLMAEFAWRPNSSVSWRRSQEVKLVLWNNVWRGTESDPADDPIEPGGVPWLLPALVGITASVVNNHATANTLQDVTGLQFPVQNGKRYRFRFMIPYTAAATGTGSRWTLNGPSVSQLNYTSRYPTAATTETVNHHSTFNAPSGCNASSLAAGNLATIEGTLTAAADGDVIARFASEVSGSAITALAGAHVEYTELP